MARVGSHTVLWQTLNLLARAPRYNRWVMGHFLPYVGTSVLEVGCGIGNMTPYFLSAQTVVGLDVLVHAVELAQARWQHAPHVRFLVGDITDPQTIERLRTYHFDTLAFVNVLEHIQDDEVALRHAYHLLAPGGHILIYAPASPKLFNTLDVALGHQRRYTCRGLTERLTRAGFEPLFCRTLNLVGMAGWWFDGRVRKHRVIPAWQVHAFDLMVPILQPAEKALRTLWPSMPGLSLACVARRS